MHDNWCSSDDFPYLNQGGWLVNTLLFDVIARSACRRKFRTQDEISILSIAILHI